MTKESKPVKQTKESKEPKGAESRDDRAQAAASELSRGSGMDASVWLPLVIKYGTAFANLLMQLMAEWKAPPQARGATGATGAGTCDPALAEALATNESAALAALLAAHNARHVAGCCDHDVPPDPQVCL